MNEQNVVMRSVYGIMFLLLTSCGEITDFIKKPKDRRVHSTTNPVFRPYIASFEAHARNYSGNSYFKVGDIPINFGGIENDSLTGVCFLYGDGKKEIIIKKSWWDKVSDNMLKESLIFHELGHCRLGRDDENGVFSGTKVKRTLMSHKIVTSKNYRTYKKAYLKELFTHSKKDLKECLENAASSLCR